MTKLRWDKADEHQQDPGAVVKVQEAMRPERWTPPQERELKRAERARTNLELRQRSEEHDRQLLEAGLGQRIRARLASGELVSALEMLFLKRWEKAANHPES